MHYWIMLLRLAIVLVPSYVAAYLTGEMVWGGSNFGCIWSRCCRCKFQNTNNPCG